ncbi:alpha-L-fucosidase [Streptomyces sp. NPDC001933]|uniref:alpha-L-fucosidase n=1 Tax=Streptomyces sp. NPDC001933 TaxID=3364626 RepID=UPI00369B8FAA
MEHRRHRQRLLRLYRRERRLTDEPGRGGGGGGPPPRGGGGGAPPPGGGGRGPTAKGVRQAGESVPTLVDGDDRTPATTYTYRADDYNAYFMNQLYELLTQYGQIDEVWLDGADPWAGQYDQPYQTTDWYDPIGKIAPHANAAINGPGIRWVGTETASGRDDDWSVIPFKGDPASRNRDDDMVVAPEGDDLAPRNVLTAHHPDYLARYPAESDVSIRPGWFWHASQDSRVKTPAKLLDLYRTSVGRNSVLLLNVPPTGTAGSAIRTPPRRCPSDRPYAPRTAPTRWSPPEAPR